MFTLVSNINHCCTIKRFCNLKLNLSIKSPYENIFACQQTEPSLDIKWSRNSSKISFASVAALLRISCRLVNTCKFSTSDLHDPGTTFLSGSSASIDPNRV